MKGGEENSQKHICIPYLQRQWCGDVQREGEAGLGRGGQKWEIEDNSNSVNNKIK